MGSGIAESAARAGIEVLVHEPDAAALDRSRTGIEASLGRVVARGQLGEDDARDALERISHTTNITDLAAADGVIEAIVEGVDVKTALFSQLDTLLPDAIFLASNTSSIPIAELAAATQRPERVLGLHFFSPVPVMSLVEIVIALETGTPATDAAHAFVDHLGKQAIVTKDRSRVHREHAAGSPTNRDRDVIQLSAQR